MPYADCVDCGEEFWREEDEWWKKRCYGCWLDNKQEPGRRKSELYELREQNQQLREAVSDMQEDFAKLFKYVGFLIFACHPDRMPDSRKDVAHEVMVWLNAKREQFK